MVDATRDLILNAEDIALVPLEVPEWKNSDGNPLTVYIKQMSGLDAEEYIESMGEANGGNKDRNAKVLVASLCDASGEKLFTKSDIDAINRKNSRVLGWIVERVLETNFKSTSQVEEDAKKLLNRPLHLFALRAGRDFGIDADVILTWPLSKIYRYMAFYLTESEEFQKKAKKETVMPFEELIRTMERDGFL